LELVPAMGIIHSYRKGRDMERIGRAKGERGWRRTMPAAALPTGGRGNPGLEGNGMMGGATDGLAGAKRGGGRYEWL
jgi:hypothetical protein